MTAEITGIDYLTGDDVPANQLNLISKDSLTDFTTEFAEFAALFVAKYGASNKAFAPVLVTDESLETIRRWYSNGLVIEPPSRNGKYY